MINCFECCLNSAFKINLRRYTMAGLESSVMTLTSRLNEVGWCMLKLVDIRVDSAWFQLVKLKYAMLLSTFAFNYISAATTRERTAGEPRRWAAAVAAAASKAARPPHPRG
jgi:hypothetical protein